MDCGKERLLSYDGGKERLLSYDGGTQLSSVCYLTSLFDCPTDRNELAGCSCLSLIEFHELRKTTTVLSRAGDMLIRGNSFASLLVIKPQETALSAYVAEYGAIRPEFEPRGATPR